MGDTQEEGKGGKVIYIIIFAKIDVRISTQQGGAVQVMGDVCSYLSARMGLRLWLDFSSEHTARVARVWL